MNFGIQIAIGLGFILVAASGAKGDPTSESGSLAVEATPPAKISHPYWTRRPDADDLARVYPRWALKAGQGGLVNVNCKVADGHLTECTATADPSGRGFEEAGLKLASIFRMSIKTREGNSTNGAKITLPIRFNPPR